MVKIEMTGFEEALKIFDSKKVRLAANSAVNKTADQTRTFASREISGQYNIQPSRIAKYLKVSTRSNTGDLQAVITGSGMGIALSYFKPKQEGVTVNKAGFKYNRRAKKAGEGRKYGGSVSVEIKRGKRKTLTKDIPKPFMSKFKSGHIAVVKRIGNKRLPIEELYGPGVGLLFGSKNIMPKIQSFANDKIKTIFKHELDYRLKK